MHVLILTGGYLNPSFAKEYCKTLSFDKVFAVDRGLEYAEILELRPDYIVGDFDTVDPAILDRYEEKIVSGQMDAVIDRYPAKKDATDTEAALWHAWKIGAKEVTILGATGSRMDHVLMNMNLLLQAQEHGMDCQMVDDTNRIRILCDTKENNTLVIEKTKQFGTYLSIIPMTAVVEGLCIEGVAYPLWHACIKQGSSLTVSNEIQENEARITLESGRVWVIESMDERK